MTYPNEALYVSDTQRLQERLVRVRKIIDGLEERMLDAGVNSSIYQQTMVDDGQTKVMSEYRSVQQIGEAIIKYERIEQSLINKLQGRGIKLIPGRSGL